MGHVSAPVSETASNPRAALSVPDPTQAQVPAQLWLRSGRPMFGTAIRVYVAFSIIVSALIFVPRGPVLWGMLGAGVLAFVLFPLVVQGLLAPLERRVLAAGRREATPLLQEVRARGLVRRFAPHAWLTLQEGRLHLRRGDGRAAARAFTETLRLSRNADSPALISAQAQALLLADQPEQARELLVALGRRQALGAGDQLTLGLALLGGKGNGREALAHVQAAQAGLGDLPRVLAALALALHRADQAEAGLVALQQAQDSLGSEPDPFDEALIQRGVKLLRTAQKAQDRRERKGQGKRERVEPVARVAEAAPSKPGAVDERPVSPAKSARKAKKDERRASRRAAKAEKRTAGPEAPVKANKAAKVAPKGKAAKAIEPHKLKAVTPVAAVAKPVDMAQETGSRPASTAKPVEVVAAKPVEASAAKPVEVAAKPVEVVAAKPVEVAAAKPVEVVAAKPVEVAAAKPVEVVAAKPAQETGSRPVAAVEPAKAPVAAAQSVAPATPKPPVSGLGQRPEAARAPAPPPGAALFGSVAAKPAGAPAPAFAAPPAGLRLPPRPVASGPALTPAVAPPVVRAPLPVGGPAVPKAMSPIGSGSVAGPQSLATPVASPIGVSPPMPAASASPIAAQAPVAPSLVMPVPVAPSLVMPVPLPAPPQVQAQGLVAPPQVQAQGLVAPPQVQAQGFVAPVLVPQPGPTPRVGDGPRPALAQVLPDTDDEWDDMLDALEADNTRG